MITLQSERIASDAAVVPEIGGGVTINSGANSKATERVITSSVAQKSAKEVDLGQAHGSTFDERDRSGVALVEATDAQEMMID